MGVAKNVLQILGAAAFVGSAWMAVQSYRGIPAAAAAAAQAARDPPECRALLADDVSNRDYEEEVRRNHPPSNYLHFPAADRPLMRRADIESVQCPGDYPYGLRACNRWHCIALELERRGWCWGGGEINAEDHWYRCEEIPDDPPLPSELPFSEEEIRQWAQEADGDRKPPR